MMDKQKKGVSKYGEPSRGETKTSVRKAVEKKRRKSETSDESEDERKKTMSAYEQLRLKNIEEREKFLRSLGIDKALEDLKEVSSVKKKSTPKVKTPQEPPPRREPSTRIQNMESNKDSKAIGSVSLGNELLERLGLAMSETRFEPEIDVTFLDVSSFQECLQSFRLLGKPKNVVPHKVSSILVHPITNKQLVIAGDSSGLLGFWDLGAEDEVPSARFKVHTQPISCISVSPTDTKKVFTTAHDGTLGCADLERQLFLKLYATGFRDNDHYLTWHDLVDANRILLSNHNGKVGVLDLRENNTIKLKTWIPCFEQSARTVQHHPLKDNYFLVSSGTQHSCMVFDIRSCSNRRAEPISEMPHAKGLTSAFFSSSGAYVLTSCNNNSLRLYSSPLQKRPRIKLDISHTTERLYADFRAVWHPTRSDVFMVCNHLTPQSIQLYGLDGSVVAELKYGKKTTATPVISAHPILPLIVGGNTSGWVFPFCYYDE